VIAQAKPSNRATHHANARCSGRKKSWEKLNFRASAHFTAVLDYGRYFSATMPQTASSADFTQKRSPQDDVYKPIIEDFNRDENAGLAWMDGSGVSY
jgi:hypothetical protein